MRVCHPQRHGYPDLLGTGNLFLAWEGAEDDSLPQHILLDHTRFAALETSAAFCYTARMTLYEALKTARSEEDVKDIYIKALALKGYTKGEVDIRTSKIWFEAKKGSDWPTYRMFTELCYYVYEAIKRGEALPAFLSVIDSEKAAIMPTAAIEPLLREHGAEVPWGRRY